MGISRERNSPIRDNWKCIIICLAMSMANCQYGYDTATIAGFQAMPGFLQVFGYEDPRTHKWNIKTKPQQLISSFLNVGTIVGVLGTGMFARFFGRRPAIWLAALIGFTASGVQLGTKSLAGLCVGRALIGVSNGFLITFSNVYTAEASPAHLRAVLVSFFGVWVTIGSLLGSIADNFSTKLDDRLAYQIPLASLFAIPFCLCIFVMFIPESPRWLLVQGRPNEARRALERLRGNSLRTEFLEEEYVEMARGIEEEKELASSVQLLDMFRGTDLRRTLLCGIVILSHSSSGIWLQIAYGTYFFKIAGINEPFQTGIYTTLAAFIGVLVGLVMMFRLMGRRAMMLTGTGAGALCMLAMGIAYTVSPNSKAAGRAVVAFSVIFGFFYNGFSGSISWPVAGELVSSRLRVLTIGMATGVNYFFSWLISYCTPYFINTANLDWGPKYCYIWAGSNAITFAAFYFFLPEMKGRSLEELDELFQNRVSVRLFPRYQCVSSDRAREIATKEIHLDPIEKQDHRLKEFNAYI